MDISLSPCFMCYFRNPSDGHRPVCFNTSNPGDAMMESAGLVIDALGRVRDMVRGALQDLSPAELMAPPKPPIAWFWANRR
jgi:hypothetical protein